MATNETFRGTNTQESGMSETSGELRDGEEKVSQEEREQNIDTENEGSENLNTAESLEEEKEFETIEALDEEFTNRFGVFKRLSAKFSANENLSAKESLEYEEVQKLIDNGKKVEDKFNSILHEDKNFEKTLKQKYLDILNSTINLLEIKESNNVDIDNEVEQSESEAENQSETAEGEDNEEFDSEQIRRNTRESMGLVEKGEETVRGKYLRVKKEYNEAMDQYYSRGGFSGNVDKVKRFFGLGLRDLPDNLKSLQLDYQESKASYVSDLNNRLKERSKKTYEGFNEDGTPRVVENRAYDENNAKTKMAFLDKFVLKTNQELLQRQEVNLLSENVRKRRDRILETLTKNKTATMVGIGGASFLMGGIPALAALAAGMGARKLTQKFSVDKAKTKAETIKSNFSISNSLDDFERELLEAEISVKDKVRNQRAISLAAAVVAGGATHSYMPEGVDLSSVQESGQSISEDFSEKMGEKLDDMTEKSKEILDELSKFVGESGQVESSVTDNEAFGVHETDPEMTPEVTNEGAEVVASDGEVTNLGFAEEGGIESGLEVSHEYKVVKGDNLWRIIRSEYSEVLSDLSPKEQNVALNELFNVVRDSPELIESLNLKSGNNIDLIYPNETIDVGQLGEELKRIVGYGDSISESSTYTKSSNLDILSDSGEGDVKIKFKAENPFENNLNVSLNEVQPEELLKKYEPANIDFSVQEDLPTDQVESIKSPVDVEPKPSVVTPDVFDNVAKAEASEGVQHAVYREPVPPYEFVSQGTPEFNEMIENIYGSKEKFDLEVIKEAKMIESESYDFLDKWFKKDSPYEAFLQDMTIGEIADFDNQARAVIDQELGSNMKYETYRKWVEFTEHLKEVDPNISSDTKLKEVFSEFVMNNKLAEIIPEVSSNKTISV